MENNSNKDFLEEELTSEKENDTSIEDTNSLNPEDIEGAEDKISSDDTNSENADETDVSDTATDTIKSNVNAKPVKSKGLIQFPLIIAAGILAAAMLAFGIWKVFFDISIEGTWVWENSSGVATVDQADVNIDSNLYVNFTSKITDEEKGYKEVSAYQGTQEQYASYYIEENEDGTKSLQSSFGLAGNYEITGNLITGKTMVITATAYDGTEVQQIFRSASLPKVELPPVSDEFKVDENVVGEWEESNGRATYTFGEDGTFILNQYDTIILKGTYVVYEDEGKITLSYIGQVDQVFGVQPFDITYAKDGDTLLIDGLTYTKATAEEN